MADEMVPADWKSVFHAVLTTGPIRKAIGKFIDTIGEQTGLVLQPRHIRRNAEADADAAITKAEADAEIALIKAQSKAEIEVFQLEHRQVIRDLRDRANERVRTREQQRQENLEAIARQAIQSLPDEVEEQPVDKDWTAEFINQSQDVSNEEMQSVWARILAGEVAKPGSFSKRTLAVVRTMSTKDAHVFIRFCSLVWEHTDQTPHTLRPLVLRMDELLETELQLGVKDIAHLDSMGLIRYENRTGHPIEFVVNIDNPPTNIYTHWSYYGKRYIFTSPILDKVMRARGGGISQFTHSFQTGPISLTDVGSELFPISGSEPNDTYLEHTILELSRMGWHVTVRP